MDKIVRREKKYQQRKVIRERGRENEIETFVQKSRCGD